MDICGLTRHSSQLRSHQIRVIISAHRASTRLNRPTIRGYGWSDNTTILQLGVPRPIQCLIVFGTSVVESRFSCKQVFHSGTLRGGPFFDYGVEPYQTGWLWCTAGLNRTSWTHFRGFLPQFPQPTPNPSNPSSPFPSAPSRSCRYFSPRQRAQQGHSEDLGCVRSSPNMLWNLVQAETTPIGI